MAVKYVMDMTPKRVRAYVCTSTKELVIRPRVTSSHADTLIVRGIPDMNAAWKAVMETGIPLQQLYIVDHVVWSEDTNVLPQYRRPA